MLVDLYDRPSGCGRTLEVLREREREEGRKTKDGKIGTGKGEEWERETAEVGCGSRLGRIQSQRQFIRLITDAKLALVCSLWLLSNILAYTKAVYTAAACGDYRITHFSSQQNEAKFDGWIVKPGTFAITNSKLLDMFSDVYHVFLRSLIKTAQRMTIEDLSIQFLNLSLSILNPVRSTVPDCEFKSSKYKPKST